MSEYEPTYLMCNRVADGPSSIEATEGVCIRCKAPVHVSIASAELLKRPDVVGIACHDCYWILKPYREDAEIFISDAQLDELEKKFGYRVERDEVIARVRAGIAAERKRS